MQEKNITIGSRMDKFKEEFRKRGYYFTNKQVLTQAFLAYTYYETKQKGLSAILLEGSPRSWKNILCRNACKYR